MRAPHIGHIGGGRKTRSCCLAANRTLFRYRTSLLYIEGAHITSQGANVYTRDPIHQDILICIQGAPKKMDHKDSELKSVLEVRFYFSTYVFKNQNF